ncbi:acyl-CoA dehydrogenase family protein [Corallococcus exiguus]|uniref:acyl-CoA dehydrogenase family protein n=1 Tax=Corallococcus exiguus TaxID=83462 RepID=UPI001471D266|nr:acyl-CoA dehydrogenase family protein [Corallococcus exiguus]NNB89477.1 acyl-CoA/acyl-ACP dehydrogenase [Corallococcus exiguus]
MDSTETRDAIRASVRALCNRFPPKYWRTLDAEREYPHDFVKALTEAGLLAALIPAEYGGAGLGLREAAVVLGEINHFGGNASACHAQMYVMNVLLRHGSAEQKQRYLPELAAGRLRLQAFAVTEPNSGSDTTAIETTAVRRGDRYVVNGQKIFISRVLQSDLMLLLARTTPRAEVRKKTDGMSVFLLDLRKTQGMEVRPIRTMLNHATNALFFENVEVPVEGLIGEEGKGFSYILDGMNAERVLVASEAIGDGRWFIEKAVTYAQERSVFGKPIGANQGVQFPIAKAHTALTAASLLTEQAATLFDGHQPCGAEANMAKYLAAEAAWEAANACMDTYGGYGFAEEYDVERKFREVRLFINAPVSRNMALSYISQHVLGLPRSFT